jgi:arylsulfatase A-like enzyme
MFRRLLQFSVPSAIGVGVAGLVAALAETIVHTERALEAFAGAGFLLLFALPIGFAISLLGRWIIGAWHLDTLIPPMKDERGAAPRWAAWIVFFVVASLLQILGTFQGMRGLFAGTRMGSLIVTAAPIVVLAITLVLVLISRPLVGVIERTMRRIEDKRAGQDKVALFTPRKVGVAVFLLAFLVMLGSWFLMVLPKLGHLDISFVLYLAIFLAVLIVVPLVWQRQLLAPMVSRGVAVLTPLTLVTCLCLSAWMRYERPYNMLEIWGDTKLAGWAIDTIFDVQALRVDLEIEGIEPTEKEGATHPNVVIITIDTVRADHLPMHGGKAKMPALADLSRSGAIFERAYSPGNVTRRSLPTVATGLSPRRMRGRVVGWALRMDPRHVLLAERFRAGGYDTAGFFCCRSHFGRDHKLGLIRGLEKVGIEYAGDALTKQAVDWLKKRGQRDKPLFLWTHYIEPHNWMKDHKPKEGARRKKDRYNLSLEATDGFLKELVAGIKESLGPDTIIVVTSDHGEGLGDHGVQHHSGGLFNSEVRVPLVIVGPGIKASRVQQAVGLVDLAPTLLELAGFEAPGMPQMDGLSVAPELLDQRQDELGRGEAYSVMVADRSVQESQAAVMSGRYKLIERAGSKYQLYDLSHDPKEKNDIKEHAPELLRSMKARLSRRKRLDQVPPF